MLAVRGLVWQQCECGLLPGTWWERHARSSGVLTFDASHFPIFYPLKPNLAAWGAESQSHDRHI